MSTENKIKMSFEERANIVIKKIAKQPPVTLEEMKAQIKRVQKIAKNSFALAAPQAQEDLKKIKTPLSSEDARMICRWLFRKQITTDMIPNDVLVQLKETEVYQGTIRRIAEIKKSN